MIKQLLMSTNQRTYQDHKMFKILFNMPSVSTLLIIFILILDLSCSTVNSEIQPASSFRKKESGIKQLLVEEETTPAAADGCQLSAKVSCTIDYNKENCDDMIIRPGECNYVDITFEYGVCNEGRSTINIVLGQTTGHVLKDVFHVKLPQVSDLGPKECRMFSRTSRVNTCVNIYQTIVEMEGWVRDDGMWSFCKAEDQFKYVRQVIPMTE